MNLKYGHVIHDVLMLANGFRSCKLFHVKHIGNSVGPFLVRKIVSSNELQVWIESSPNDIAPSVIRDSL